MTGTRPHHASRAFDLSPTLFHLSLVLRVGGSLADGFVLRQWGAATNAATLVVFILTLAGSIGRQAKKARRRAAGTGLG